MQIIDFTASHIEQAVRIAKQNYDGERRFVPALPPVTAWPDMSCFTENSLGVAAFESGRMVGFLCCLNPWDNAYDIPGLRGVFSPMHGNGTVSENRAKIYAQLYQAAGEKWAYIGAASHGICLYAHDTDGQKQFYRYGFGIRCIDAVRPVEVFDAPQCDGYTFSELTPENVLEILPLENMLDGGFIGSPFFMFRKQSGEIDFLKKYEHFKSVYITAKYKGQIIAYIRAELDGETFIKEIPGYLHIKGAFCLPEHRGKGISHKLLSLLVQKLKEQGYTCLGVDFESFNPSGSGFWLKHFTAYTHSVVRRIDENTITRNKI